MQYESVNLKPQTIQYKEKKVKNLKTKWQIFVRDIYNTDMA
jgi:hypothetical protein